MTVKRLLQRRGERTLITVTPETLVFDAIKLMADHDIGALLVMDGGQLVGIISERDYLTKLILQGRHSNETKVGEVMTGRVLYVEPTRTVEECMALMSEKRVRHLPVLDGGRIVGIISIRDVIAYVVDQKEFMIEQLETYIHGPSIAR
jgi:CBS domain-containing protein